MPLPTREPFALTERDLRRTIVRLVYVIETSNDQAEVEKAKTVLVAVKSAYQLVEADKK